VKKAMFQSYAGPSDPALKRSEIEGYQPVSRIGEVVVNAFVDGYEFAAMDDHISREQLTGDATNVFPTAEYKPPFHEWASALPGMIALSRKSRSTTFRNYVAAETAAPVIVCAACQHSDKEDAWFFAGVVRSKSVRTPDDGVGPNTDEFFTLSIGGMATVLNTGTDAIFPGDMLEWTFLSEVKGGDKANYKRQKSSCPRRIGIKVADPLSAKLIGKALSFAKPAESLDILIKGC
jgi:hypothetical protein